MTGSAQSPFLFSMGDALVDMMSSEPDRTLDAADVFIRCPGGSALNTTVGAARLGVPVAFCSAVGNDPFGHFLVEYLQAEGVDTTSLFVRRGASTGVAFASCPQGQPDFHILRGHTAPAEQLCKDHVPADALRWVRCFHLCSLFVYRYAPRGFVSACLDEAHRNGLLVSFDPNVRPHAIDDESSARDRIAECSSRAHIVKLSQDDACWLHPGVHPEDVVRRYVQEGAVVSILTRGSDGALLAMQRAGGVVSLDELEAHPAKVKDAVGAGDAYMAGLLAALYHCGVHDPESLRRLDFGAVRSACRLASRAASAACSATGALSGLDHVAVGAWSDEMSEWISSC